MMREGLGLEGNRYILNSQRKTGIMTQYCMSEFQCTMIEYYFIPLNCENEILTNGTSTVKIKAAMTIMNRTQTN